MAGRFAQVLNNRLSVIVAVAQPDSIGEAYSVCTAGAELKLCFRARGRAIAFKHAPLIQDGCPRFPRKAVTVALEVAICLPWTRGSGGPPLGCVGMILSAQTSTRRGACKMARLAMDLVRQVTMLLGWAYEPARVTAGSQATGGTYH